MTALLDSALRRHRAVTIAALVVLTLLAWAWMFGGAGMGMDPMVSLAAYPTGDDSMSGMAPATPWSPGRLMLTFSMWWVMMVAMMLPAAAPTILLYNRAAASGAVAIRPATEAFLAGYLIAWGGFSLLATLLQMLLQSSDLLARMQMASVNSTLSAAILIGAGLYQLSPLKQACLKHCRSPAHFISRNFRPGSVGALRMGLLHGTYCIGCCWLLMALLFVGGVMNLAWIALLTLLVAAEKLLPFGRLIGIAAGAGCLAWGALFLAQG